MIEKILLYIAVGTIFTGIQTMITKSIINDRRLIASSLSGLLTLIRLTTMAFVMADAMNQDFVGVISLATGTAIGTFIALKIKMKKK